MTMNCIIWDFAVGLQCKTSTGKVDMKNQNIRLGKMNRKRLKIEKQK